MLTMQYSFTLPSDYDMSIIERRVAERGHMLDALPGLRFKAYLMASKADDRLGTSENLYAPFYVWASDAAFSDFICGKGFEGLTASFGWPSVQTWTAWEALVAEDAFRAAWATRETVSMASHANLDAIRRLQIDDARSDMESGALAAVAGFEPVTWTLVRFRLWAGTPTGGLKTGVQAYSVSHMSIPSPG